MFLFEQEFSFLSRFCFLSGRGRFEYLIEFERRFGEPQLLLYYDDVTQWPAVYKTKKVSSNLLTNLSLQSLTNLYMYIIDQPIYEVVPTKVGRPEQQ